MEESSPSTTKSKWQGRLALLFALLFSIFWSLDSFFFWVLLGLSTGFGLLTLLSSGIIISLFNRPPTPQNPYRIYQSPPTDSAPADPVFILRKIMRVVLIVAAGIVVFLFVVGIFADKSPDTKTDSEQPKNLTSTTVDTNALNEKGNAFFNQANYDSSLWYYEKALVANPNDQYALYNKALVFLMKQDYRYSITIVKKCLRLYPDYNEGMWLLGDDYYSMHNYDSAQFTLEQAYDNGFKDPGFMQLMGDVYLKKDNRAKAAEFYKNVIAIDTTKVEVYKQLIELDPDNADWYRKKANSLESNSK